MKIYLEQIPDSGLELRENCLPASLDLERADLYFSEPIQLIAQVSKGLNNISVHLVITTRLQLDCNRCLEQFVVPFSKKTDLNFMIEEGKEIDLTDSLREEIILSVPLKALCRPDCAGLCMHCGQNLNKARCQCISKNKFALKPAKYKGVKLWLYPKGDILKQDVTKEGRTID